MLQVLADGVVVYDSRLDDNGLLALKVTRGLNKAGTAELTMPPNHPAYSLFTAYRTTVEIYKDRGLYFRGRALYPSDDFYNRRTIVCEGELNFLRDAVSRPYVYQDAPAAIFREVIGLYNAQVEAFKQFRVGAVTVTDPNNYIRLESGQAEQVSDTVKKLVDRCGGYIVFTYDGEGQSVINWLPELTARSNQVVEFGSNLLDYSRTAANTDLATVVVPYGAKDETTGERITVESVNDGLDFIQDYDAVALRGVIAKPVYWDDITEPANLLAKAQQYLAESRSLVMALELSAVDLSALDKSIDRFYIGDKIRVRSKPHGIDEDFLLTEQTVDLLDPAGGKITLGKDVATLTGADAAGDSRNAADLDRVEQIVVADYTANTAKAVQETKETLTSLIQQTADSLRLEVTESTMTGEEVEELISTNMTQLADSFSFNFDSLRAVVDNNAAEAVEQFEEIHKYIRFEGGDIVLGEDGNELTLRIENDRISFLDDGAEVAYLSNKRLYVTDGHFLHSLRVGGFMALPRENGNLSFVKVVE